MGSPSITLAAKCYGWDVYGHPSGFHQAGRPEYSIDGWMENSDSFDQAWARPCACDFWAFPSTGKQQSRGRCQF